MKWMKNGICILCLLLFACSSTFPDQRREIYSFVPSKKGVAPADFENFSAKNFPKNCKWFDIKSVSDGDTIVLGDDTKVRFVGIDTPETVHPTKPVQYCGKEASDWTKKIFEGSEKVCLIYDKLSDKRDTYGRRLAYPFTEEGIDTTAELLQLGLARGYFYFPFSRKEEFRFYHDQAKKLQKGVWGKSVGTCEKA
jgi:endonuclease YncB( thermonuclease family)